MLCKLLSALPQDAFTSTVISLTTEGELAGRVRTAGANVFALELQRSRNLPAGALKIWQILRTVRPHIVQTWLYHSDFIGYLGGRLTSVPIIAWNIRCANMGDSYYRGVSGALVRVLAALSPRPDAIIVNSQAGKEFHENLGYRSRRWHVIPNGFDLEQFHPDDAARWRVREQLGVAESAPLIGLVARFDPSKGHRTFVSAAAILTKSHPTCSFVLAGRGCEASNPDLTELIPDSIRDRFLLLGHQPDVAALNCAFDIAVSASCYEAFPNVVGEAMACATCCVVTDVGDCREIVGEAGRVVPPNDATAMAAAWRSLIDGGVDLRRALGETGRRRVAQRYALPVVAGRYAQLYRDLAAAAGTGLDD